MGTENIDYKILSMKAGSVFTPSAPVSRKSLFAGRKNQLHRVIDVIFADGQHGILYGERGVGKTSLANILHESLIPLSDATSNFVVARVNCDQTDIFSSVWEKVFQEVRFIVTTPKAGFSREVQNSIISYADLYKGGKSIKPTDIRTVEQISDSRFIFIFDEFDRLYDLNAPGLFADTIKTLSDHISNITILLIGVADSVDQLIKEHASIDRSLVQILMPRMQSEELEAIIDVGLAELNMSIEHDAKKKIIKLSQGLPHYTHSVALSSVRHALDDLRLNIESKDVEEGVNVALSFAQQTIINAYNSAITSPRQDTLFKEVLLACALSDMDELGYFSPVNVRRPLERIIGKKIEISAFTQHLTKFTGEKRGKVLSKRGEKGRPRYRFSNPLMQPFVIMRGIQENLYKLD